MNTGVPNGKQFLTILTIVHLAMFGTMIGLGVIMFAIAQDPEFKFDTNKDPFFYIIPIASILGPYLGYAIFNRQLKGLELHSTLSKKLGSYQAASLIRFALIEMAIFLCVIAFLSSDNLLYLTIAAALALYFWTLKPRKTQIERRLAFTSDQRREFDASFH
ncbi:hypothetical protein ACFQ1M_09415 [Sungkyunkwania multivorans]|uniref:Uncharacterized protein n=1 Tax=Sungkyunkwania multivorans TaxID=1173618 RepID=A0ABW3CXA8_9FLAO